jgi:hypothetical protein
MNTTKIIITNVLPTSSAFAVLQDDHTQNVFIPSKIYDAQPFEIGETVDALLVPNVQHHSKTPWLAARIIAQPVAVVQPVQPVEVNLRAKIVAHLQEYDATFDEILNYVGGDRADINKALSQLSQDGVLMSEVVYSLKGAA